MARDVSHVAQQIDSAMLSHRSPTVLVNGQLDRLSAAARKRSTEQLSGQCAVLFGRHHPGDDEPAKQIEHHVERQITPSRASG